MSDLVLGTAQLGMQYGINNRSGMPTLDEGRKIIRAAIRHGVAYIDTARAYGLSECVVRAALSAGWRGRARVITKLSPMVELDEASEQSGVESAVRASVFESCQKLGMERLDVLMVHRAQHMHAWGGRVWAELRRLEEEGVIKALGFLSRPRRSWLRLSGTVRSDTYRCRSISSTGVGTRWCH
ncbi:aldo/keto reductase [Pseudomonas lalucatii]|nr:aldo/keto reductase [Pseudomonas lalucatii]